MQYCVHTHACEGIGVTMNLAELKANLKSLLHQKVVISEAFVLFRGTTSGKPLGADVVKAFLCDTAKTVQLVDHHIEALKGCSRNAEQALGV